MKFSCLKISIFIIAMTMAVGTFAQPQARYLKDRHDFGTINEADGKVSYTFEIENVGDEPLVILGVYVSCGCTTYEFSKEPIAPGEKGEVKVSFNPSGFKGKYIKSIHIYTNTRPKKKTVRIYSVINPE